MKRIQTGAVWLSIILIVSALILGGVFYFSSVQESLRLLSVSDLEHMTAQAGHAFSVYLQKDLQDVHGMASVMKISDSRDLAHLRVCLQAYNDTLDESYYAVVDLDKGVLYSSREDEFAVPMPEKQLAETRALPGRGIEKPYISEISGRSLLACHERFTFVDGAEALVRRAAPVEAVEREFSMSVYDGAGYSGVIDRNGDILLEGVRRDGSHVYHNIFDAMAASPGQEESIDGFRTSMTGGESGAVQYVSADRAEYVCAYAPVEGTDGWYYITVVPGAVLMKQGRQILNTSQFFLFLIALCAAGALAVALSARRDRRTAERVEHEVEYRVHLFNLLTSGTGYAMVMIDLGDKTVEYVSPNTEQLLGIPAEETKKDISILAETELDGGGFVERLDRLEPGSAFTLEEPRIHRETGERLWFAITAYRVAAEDGEKLLLIFSDRTAEKNREEALEDATNIAESANRAKSTFLSNMSHDIRTPMNAIVGLCTLIERDAGNAERVKDHTKKMLASSQHLLGLINDVLDMSKIEAGKTALNITEISLAEIVEELVTVLTPQAHAKRQTFEVSAVDVKSEHLLGDELRINQILMNILSNSIKYTPMGGRVELIIREMPQKAEGFAHIRFVIRDNGIGMSEEYKDTIFQAFTREVNSNTNKIQGTGLGMAITKSLVDLMEGNISVESAPNQGSTFTVDLDLRIQDREVDLHFWKKYGIHRMLVVDDEEEVCLHVKDKVEQAVVTVRYALGGQAAIELAERAQAAGEGFDLILMDLRMPEMDGIEATRRLRAFLPREIPILAFTAYDWYEVEETAMAAGIDGYVPKPFFLTNFEMSVARLRQEDEEPAPEDDGIMRGMHILAAEDNELNSEILHELLDMQGATCDIEENGELAVERFRASGPDEYDLILMDVQMPVMNGYDATREIRACGHPRAAVIPIIAMTADAFAEDIRRAAEAGMNAHVSKPIDLALLEEAVREVMG